MLLDFVCLSFIITNIAHYLKCLVLPWSEHMQRQSLSCTVSHWTCFSWYVSLFCLIQTGPVFEVTCYVWYNKSPRIQQYWICYITVRTLRNVYIHTTVFVIWPCFLVRVCDLQVFLVRGFSVLWSTMPEIYWNSSKYYKKGKWITAVPVKIRYGGLVNSSLRVLRYVIKTTWRQRAGPETVRPRFKFICSGV